VVRSLVAIINSTYILLADTFGFLDNSATYLVIMVLGLSYCPFLFRSIYQQYVNPHEYSQVALERKVVLGVVIVIALVAFGYLNFIRFLPTE